MKIKQIFIAGTLLVSIATFAQKEELKALKKIYAKDQTTADDLIEYKALVNKLEPLATEETDKVYATFYKTMVPLLEANTLDPKLAPMILQAKLKMLFSPESITKISQGLSQTLEYEKKSGKKIYTDDIIDTIKNFKSTLLQIAGSYEAAKKFKETSAVLYAIYNLDKTEKEYLYIAANYDLQDNDYENALKHFTELKATGYTGEGTSYLATSKLNSQKETFNSKEERDNAIKIGTHIKAEQEEKVSKAAEIDATIASLKNSMLINKANEFYKAGDIAKYQLTINEALKDNPNDVDLLFNLGVTSAEVNNFADAEKYYSKVIATKPDYYNAYLNLSDIKLKPDAAIVKEMNSLTTSDKDMKRYNVLKTNRKKIFDSALPLLEKAYELKPDDEVVKTNLLSVYRFLEMDDKAKALKVKM